MPAASCPDRRASFCLQFMTYRQPGQDVTEEASPGTRRGLCFVYDGHAIFSRGPLQSPAVVREGWQVRVLRGRHGVESRGRLIGQLGAVDDQAAFGVQVP